MEPEEYEAAIPKCCSLRTAREHYDSLLWCWGLLAAIERNEPMGCGDCEFATRKRPKTKHSFTDEKGKRWVACSECNRGGNGHDKDKCSCGWRIKKFNGLGCFVGVEIVKLEREPHGN